MAALPLTPGPLNVPPAGMAVSCTGVGLGAPTQYRLCSSGVKTTTGGATTVMRRVPVVVHKPVLGTV